MDRRRIFIVLGLFVFGLLFGCATSGDLQRVEGKIVALRTDLESTQNKQKRLLKKLQNLHQSLVKLDNVLGSFRKKGRYNFANIGSQMDELRTKHQQILGKFQDIKREFDKETERNKKLFVAYSSRFGDPTASSSTKTGQITIQIVSPKTAFASAKALYDAGKYRESRNHLKEFIKKYPSHELTDDAYILLGDAYFKLNNYFEAIILFNDVRKKFPKSDLVPEALFKLGKAHYSIKACPEGRAFFSSLLRHFRSSPFVKQARYYRRNSRKLCKKR